MKDERPSSEQLIRGPAREEEASSGLQVDEPLDIERIELDSQLRGPVSGWETVRAGGEAFELLPDLGFDLDLGDDLDDGGQPPTSRERRLEHENLQLAAELAALRESHAERERSFESRLDELATRLEERELEVTEQSAQIASLTLERDGLSARLENSSSPPPSWLERKPALRADQQEQLVASLKARLEERGRALAVAREEIEALHAERRRLTEALADRTGQITRLLRELKRHGSQRRSDGDLRGALQRLIAAARRRRVAANAPEPAAVPGPADEPGPGGAEEAATDTVVMDPPPAPVAALHEPIAPPARAAGRAPARRFLIALEPGNGDAHELSGSRVYVGRAPEAGLHIPDTTVSRIHAVLRLDGEQVVVEDAASTNGVFVNGIRVRVAALGDFDTITFGNVAYLFRLGPAIDGTALRGQ